MECNTVSTPWRISSKVGSCPLFMVAGVCLGHLSDGNWFPVPWPPCCDWLSAGLGSSSDCQLGPAGPACICQTSDSCCLTSVISDLILSIPCAMLVTALSTEQGLHGHLGRWYVYHQQETQQPPVGQVYRMGALWLPMAVSLRAYWSLVLAALTHWYFAWPSGQAQSHPLIWCHLVVQVIHTTCCGAQITCWIGCWGLLLFIHPISTAA